MTLGLGGLAVAEQDWRRLWAGSLAAGLGLGVASAAADATDNVVVLYVFNVGGPWVLTAFAIGIVVARRPWFGPVTAATCAVAALLVADAVYYLCWWAVDGRATATVVFLTLLWAGPAVAIGAVAAGGGWAWHRGSWLAGAVGVGLVSGALAGESLFVLRHIVHDRRVAAEAVLAIGLCVVLLRANRRALVVALAITAGMVLVFEAVFYLLVAVGAILRAMFL